MQLAGCARVLAGALGHRCATIRRQSALCAGLYNKGSTAFVLPCAHGMRVKAYSIRAFVHAACRFEERRRGPHRGGCGGAGGGPGGHCCGRVRVQQEVSGATGAVGLVFVLVVRPQEVQIHMRGTFGMNVRMCDTGWAWGSCVRRESTQAFARGTGWGLRNQLGQLGRAPRRAISMEHSELCALRGCVVWPPAPTRGLPRAGETDGAHPPAARCTQASTDGLRPP